MVIFHSYVSLPEGMLKLTFIRFGHRDPSQHAACHISVSMSRFSQIAPGWVSQKMSKV